MHFQSLDLRVGELRFELRPFQSEPSRFALAFEVTPVNQSQMPDARDDPVNQQLDVKFAHVQCLKIARKRKRLLLAAQKPLSREDKNRQLYERKRGTGEKMNRYAAPDLPAGDEESFRKINDQRRQQHPGVTADEPDAERIYKRHFLPEINRVDVTLQPEKHAEQRPAEEAENY